jgi:hypothetical protein
LSFARNWNPHKAAYGLKVDAGLRSIGASAILRAMPDDAFALHRKAEACRLLAEMKRSAERKALWLKRALLGAACYKGREVN